MEISGVHERATAFETAAQVYESSRPGYPPDAVRWLVEALGLGPGRRVVDLAAGTGKLTRDLVPTGAHVIAVEPVPAMRRTLAAMAHTASPDVPVSVVAGVAQALPFGDGCLDAMTVAQGFHWFATDDAVAEMHRVLRPGAALALIWNHRDTSDGLQAALTGLMEPWRGDTPSYDSGAWRDVLQPARLLAATAETHVPWRQPVDIEGVADRVASISFIAAMDRSDRERLLDQVRVAAADVAPPLELAYVADVFVFTRRS
jgi:SAM-dependent methyltransferase